MKHILIALVLITNLLFSALAQASTWRDLALQFMYKGQAAQAITYYKQAASLDPSNGVIQSELAYAYQLSKDYDTALTEYTVALGLTNAPIADIKFNIATIYAYKKDWKNAMLYYNDILAIDKSYVDAYLNKAIVETHLEIFREAEKDYTSVLSLAPEHLQKIEIQEMIKLLSQLREFPVENIDKTRYKEKQTLIEELNSKRERLENTSINKYLGEK